jgi:plasmid stabilization system protein ParE
MVQQIIFKKRFRHKLDKILLYLEAEFGLFVAKKFAEQLDKKFQSLLLQPFTGTPSQTFPAVRSIRAGKYNRIYYKVENNRIIIINIYDTRINPAKNKFK